MTNIRPVFLFGCAFVALAGCGASSTGTAARTTMPVSAPAQREPSQEQESAFAMEPPFAPGMREAAEAGLAELLPALAKSYHASGHPFPAQGTANALGSPYALYTARQDALSNHDANPSDIFVPLDEWVVPVAMGNEHLLLTVVQTEDGWSGVELGDAALASAIAEFEESLEPANQPPIRVLLRLRRLYADFVAVFPSDQAKESWAGVQLHALPSGEPLVEGRTTFSPEELIREIAPRYQSSSER